MNNHFFQIFDTKHMINSSHPTDEKPCKLMHNALIINEVYIVIQTYMVMKMVRYISHKVVSFFLGHTV